MLEGRAESTRISENADTFQPGQKREPHWWLNGSEKVNAIKVKVREELEEMYLKNEYESSLNSSFDPNGTRDSVISPALRESTFPIGLNPGYDLQAFIQVLTNKIDKIDASLIV